MTFETIASLASTITSAVLASVALLFSYRQNVGWPPIAFLTASGLKVGNGQRSITVTVELWNRRKYPVVVRHITMITTGVKLDDRRGSQPGDDFVHDNTLHRTVDTPIGPGEHLKLDIEAEHASQSLDAMRAVLTVKALYFDPYRHKNLPLSFKHKLFHPHLGWKLSKAQRITAQARFEGLAVPNAPD